MPWDIEIKSHDIKSITSSDIVEVGFPEKGIAVSFTVPFLYELLINADQEAFSRLTKSTTEDFTPSGK
jgi:hypothetical protein